MQPLKKVTELLTQKYNSPIVVIGNNKASKRKSIFDTENFTLFTVLNNSSYTFKDMEGNFWMTVPKSFLFNEKQYYPDVGTQYTRTDGIKYSFVTEEVIIAKATDYFEKFIDKDYGLEKELSFLLFFYEGDQHIGVFSRFKSKIHDKIDAFISNN